MMNFARVRTMLGATLAVLGIGGAAHAANIDVTADITTSATWTANNVYNLTKQIYVRNNATLTIEAGTVIATKLNTAPVGDPTNGEGSLAVVRGGQIFIQGTAQNPVIMTSAADRATWTSNNPATGTWRAASNEWGNLTIMGRAYVSENAVATNLQTCDNANYGVMEGLIADDANDTKVRYGGGNDDNDSGTITYLSLRYGGKVIGLNNELNGLSLGGVGRETDIHHVEIMNNIDDGIEIWGGTVNLKYINIWNIGDDSLDLDQGWRGKAQFGLIVQGYSKSNGTSGSGLGDNSLEMDGAEDSDAQPVTTATIYNFTVIGQPASGDHATAWRDNARVQLRNCIFMDTADDLIKNDNVDGDGGHGYGFNGTRTWAQTWNANYTYSTDEGTGDPNICTGLTAALYTAQTSGKLAEISDSVFYRNQSANAYVESNARGVTNAGGSQRTLHNVVPTFNASGLNMPIVSLTRGAPEGPSNTVVRVTKINPKAANDALSSFAAAPNDGFFTPASFRGAFGPNDTWLCGWTATQAFGFLEAAACATPCLADINNTGGVNTDDLIVLIASWGACVNCGSCPADIAPAGGNCQVNTDDLIALIGAWGPCP